MINEVAHEIIAEIVFHCKAKRLCLSTEVSLRSRHKAAAITLNGIQLNALPHRPCSTDQGSAERGHTGRFIDQPCDGV